MFSLKNIINSYMFIFGLNFQERWPGFSENNENPTENTESIAEQVFWPEQQEIMLELDRLEQKYDTLINTQKISKWIADRLLRWLTSDPEIQNDPEAQPTIDMFNYYRNQYTESMSESWDINQKITELRQRISQVSNSLEHEAWIDYNDKTWEIEELDFSKEELKNISNVDFLSISQEKRLQYITKNNIDSIDVSSWNINSLEFTFTYDWEFNRELFLETTAGHVLPKEVWSVISWWVEYTRTGIKWEFFNWNNRLTIHEWTDLTVSKLRTPEEIDSINNWIESWLEWYEWELQKSIARESLNRWIEPDLVMETFESILSEIPEVQYELKLEQLFTQMERIRGDYWLDNNSERLKDFIVDNDWDWSIDAYSRFNGKIDFSNIELREWEKWLLDMISIFESGGNYNSIYWNANQSRIDFTQMTIWEVQNYQRNFVNSWQPSSAIWKYQFISSTLRAAANETGLWMDAKFSPENQDKMWLYLLKIRWLDSFMSWSMSVEQFQLNLSKEWAAIPRDMSGKSYYDWDWLNTAHLPSEQIRSYLSNMRQV